MVALVFKYVWGHCMLNISLMQTFSVCDVICAALFCHLHWSFKQMVQLQCLKGSSFGLYNGFM